MVSEQNLQALHALCSGRDAVLGGIVTHYGLTGSPALGETARDVAKGLPIRLLHGGSHAAWLAAHGLMEERSMFPLMARLERELRGCRREVYRHMGRHDAAWLAEVEAHVRDSSEIQPAEQNREPTFFYFSHLPLSVLQCAGSVLRLPKRQKAPQRGEYFYAVRSQLPAGRVRWRPVVALALASPSALARRGLQLANTWL